MNTASISPGRLFKDSLSAVGSIYGPILLLNFPVLVFILLNSFLQSPILLGILNLIYYFVLVPLISGATIIYTYRHLNQNHIGLAEAFQAAVSKYLQLLFGLILLIIILIPAFILLIVPGIYLSVRLSFFIYAIAVEDYSAIEGIKRSWELTEGRWWSIFWALLAVSLALFVPIVIISVLVTATLTEETRNIASQVVSGILAYLVGPILSVYYVLLYAALQYRDRRQQAESS